MEVGIKIKQYILENGMTLGFIAKKSEIEPKKFYRIINGGQRMTVEEFEQICKKGLGVKPSFFLK